MASRTKMKNAEIAARSAAPPKVPAELLDQFMTGGTMTAAQVNRTTLAFKKALIERALGGELSHHLGYAVGNDKPAGAANQRNGSSAKTVITGDGPVRVEVPRDRDASFEPLLIPKHERRFTGFDDKILALYSRGMSTNDIQEVLKELYGVDVDSSLVSIVTNGVLEEIKLFLTIRRT